MIFSYYLRHYIQLATRLYLFSPNIVTSTGSCLEVGRCPQVASTVNKHETWCTFSCCIFIMINLLGTCLCEAENKR